VTTLDEVRASPQLAARDYWQDVEHPELERAVSYPGPFARFAAHPIRYRRRPPTVGEHNHEIYAGELGLDVAGLVRRGSV
jgi:crotonobetainyl-CoA:carnitine CoA-transferase CaiB-like acyl-CoA transferase